METVDDDAVTRYGPKKRGVSAVGPPSMRTYKYPPSGIMARPASVEPPDPSGDITVNDNETLVVSVFAGSRPIPQADKNATSANAAVNATNTFLMLTSRWGHIPILKVTRPRGFFHLFPGFSGNIRNKTGGALDHPPRRTQDRDTTRHQGGG